MNTVCQRGKRVQLCPRSQSRAPRSRTVGFHGAVFTADSVQKESGSHGNQNVAFTFQEWDLNHGHAAFEQPPLCFGSLGWGAHMHDATLFSRSINCSPAVGFHLKGLCWWRCGPDASLQYHNSRFILAKHSNNICSHPSSPLFSFCHQFVGFYGLHDHHENRRDSGYKGPCILIAQHADDHNNISFSQSILYAALCIQKGTLGGAISLSVTRQLKNKQLIGSAAANLKLKPSKQKLN